MRVIAGIYRSRQLIAPRGLSTRPTSDRLRETLFNVLTPHVEGASFADLYAGSGAVGIEALSRGASRVSFVEKSASAAAAIRANLAALKIQAGFSIDTRSVSAVFHDLSQRRPPAPWNIVFLDPPYEAFRGYEDTLASLGCAAGVLLAPDAIVVAEHAARHHAGKSLAENYGMLRRYRVLKQGDAALSFYQPAE